MKKIIFLLLLFIIFISCNEDAETKQETAFTKISELITAVETGDNEFDEKEVFLKTNFKFDHKFAVCLAYCDSNKRLEDYGLSNTYLFQDYNLCYNKNEIVLVDEEGRKIPISNFPSYKFNEELIDYSSYFKEEKNIEISGVISYSKSYNFCTETIHPSLTIKLSAKSLETIITFFSDDDLIIIE